MIRQILINRRRIFMSSNPLSIIANFMMMQLIFKLTPVSLIGIVPLFVNTISQLIFRTGFIQTIRILLGIRQALNIKASLKVFKDILNGKANPFAIETVINLLEPEWPNIIKESFSFNKILNLLISFSAIFFIFKPVITIITRTLFISISTVLGVVYIPIFNSFDSLRKITYFILSFIPDSIIYFFPNKIKNFYQKFNSISWEEIKNMNVGFNFEKFNTHQDPSYWEIYKKYVYGAVALTTILILVDYKYPDIPYLHNTFLKQKFRF